MNGDSIVVLNHGEGMHMAMLIQNNDNKWQYFSVNGDNVYVSGKFSGGRRFDEGYIIPTTREQDTEMRNTFVKISQMKSMIFSEIIVRLQYKELWKVSDLKLMI